MSDALTSEEVAVLMEAAQALMPDEGRLPPVAESGLAETYLDAALVARPDAIPFITEFAKHAIEHGATETLRHVRAERPHLWEAVTTILPGGYFLSPQVREALGYRGQTPQLIPVDGTPDHADLISVVVDRGEVFRPTP